MTLRPPPLKIALIGFPILEMNPNVSTQALARYILQDKGWKIPLAASDGAGGIRLAEKMRCDGALVRLLDPEMARVGRSARIPLVNVSGWLSAPGVATVKFDDPAVGRLAAAHLHEQKFKSLAVIEMHGGAFNRDRCRGFLEQAAALNLRPECFRCKKEEVNWAELCNWLLGLKKPVGLFLTDDLPALRLMESLLSLGLSVPHDIAPVCGTLHPDRGGLCSPTLTSIDSDPIGVYRHAVDRLEEMIRTPDIVRPGIELIAPTGICQGESTRLPASEDPLVALALRIMDEEAPRGLNINQLCTKLGIACVTLERHFKTALGMMPHDYLTRLRITLAKRLLAESDDSIEKIAAACGFSNRSRLNLVFTTTEKLSPREWRVKCGKPRSFTGVFRGFPHPVTSRC